MTEAELHDLAGAYALDALSTDERRRFEDHLAGCVACVRELRTLREAAAALASTESTRPPLALKDAVIAGLPAVEQQRVPQMRGTADRRGTRDRRRGGRFAMAAAAAVVVAVAGIGALLGTQASRIDQLQADLERLEQIATAEDVQVTSLEGTAGTAVLFRSRAAGVLVASGVPQAAEDRVYEIWLIRDGTPHPSGLFRPEKDGRAFAQVAGDVGSADAVAVTIEPRGGSPVPTSDPVLMGEL